MPCEIEYLHPSKPIWAGLDRRLRFSVDLSRILRNWRPVRSADKSGQISRVLTVSTCLARLIFSGALFIAAPFVAHAAKDDPQVAGLCDRAAVQAARTSNVPLSVMRAISRTETGRASANGLQPWPWTVNMEGTGRWFTTLDEARAYVFKNFKRGARSFDVGCFQINYKWHGKAFRSIDDMFDPLLNAEYAAEFLTELYREFGNWSDAAGAYHSRTPKFADKYTARFDRIRAGLSGETELASAIPGDGRRPRVKRARGSRMTTGPSPLTIGQVTLGSLVPIPRQAGSALRPFVVFN